MEVDFEAWDYGPDGEFHRAAYLFAGSERDGWTIWRNHHAVLRLGSGYRLLRTLECGVCSTDLVRRFLPYPLPQVTGHEVVACDESGRRYVVEINASHAARGIGTDCPFCRCGMGKYCPDRLVLGIHDLPGGFGPWILAPVHAAIPIPEGLAPRAAVLVEPFAAALRAVAAVAPQAGDTIAVLGPRRLGLLVIAALAAVREDRPDFTILALSRSERLLRRAHALGATAWTKVEADGVSLPAGLADVVIDTSGNPVAFDLALRLARREVHVKSTHGRPVAGLGQLTELVVDELWIGGLARHEQRLSEAACAGERIAWLSPLPPPADLATANLWVGVDPRDLQVRIQTETRPPGLPRADLAVVGRVEDFDGVIRPHAGHHASLVRPGGGILLDTRSPAGEPSALSRAIRDRGLTLSSSRCGDFHSALEVMTRSPRRAELMHRLITHRFRADQLPQAFRTAQTPSCIKAVIDHPLPARSCVPEA